jgi:hypothetical protein
MKITKKKKKKNLPISKIFPVRVENEFNDSYLCEGTWLWQMNQYFQERNYRMEQKVVLREEVGINQNQHPGPHLPTPTS